MGRAGMATESMAAPTAEFSPQRIVVTARVSSMFAIR
jgi:hypothetical protein